MVRHHLDQLVTGVTVVELELFVDVFFLTDQLARVTLEQLENFVEGFGVGRIFEVQANVWIDAPFAQKSQRLAGLATARIVPNFSFLECLTIQPRDVPNSQREI